MNPYPVITRNTVLICVLFAVLFTVVIIAKHELLFRPQVVLCDVGQGDAILIQLEGSIDILIDTGPDELVLDCLDNHIPFYDRHIEVLIITHPDFDHFGGSKSVLRLYTLGTLVTPAVGRNTPAFVEFRKLLDKHNVSITFLFQGDTLSFQNLKMTAFWPPVPFMQKTTQADPSEFPLPKQEPNNYSLVLLAKTENMNLLLTGDIHEDLLETIVGQIGDIDVLKVAHHGAANGLNARILDTLKPEVALISAGKNNSYGHPHKEVIDLLKSRRVDLYRTDHDGEFIMKIP